MLTLIVAPNWIGDAVMAQPLLATLRRQQPEQRIHALCPPHIAPVFAAMPEVDSVVESPNVHGKLDLAARWRLGRALRASGYDRAIVLPNSAKSALVPWFAGIPERIGYRGEARSLLLNRVHEDRPGRRGQASGSGRGPGAGSGRGPRASGARGAPERPPMVEHYAALAWAPGQAPEGPAPDPRLAIDPALARAARERLGLPIDAPLYALCPGAEYGPAKRWPARHYAALAGLIRADEPAAAVVVLGGPKDRPVGDEIAALARTPVRNLCGETTLAEAMALLSQAAGVASNDSGLMHVAAAFDRPMVALFGSSDPRHTPPRSRHARVEWLHLDCSPCFERECPLGHLDCLERIEPARAMRSLKDAMEG